ncbi:Cox family DNA-binding protein [Escherichia coli]|uniref:Cox family DNA-binding protein n=1 Tax=Escherichia coli TaxID=562 RepID=UPI0035617535
MQESTQNAPESLCGTRCDHLSEMPEGEHQKTGRKVREREEIRLSENPSHLLSKEGFAMYIGKTVDAIVSMAKAGKLPAVYMADPLKPGGNAELYINRKAWDEACDRLIENAPPEWHDWENRLFLFKPTSGRRNRNISGKAA